MQSISKSFKLKYTSSVNHVRSKRVRVLYKGKKLPEFRLTSIKKEYQTRVLNNLENLRFMTIHNRVFFYRS